MTPDKPSATEVRELLSCPFCSGEPELICGGRGKWFALCKSCKCSSDDRQRDMVIAAWNTRASPPAPQGGERAFETIALDFENSVYHVWDNQEVADRIREVAGDFIAAFPSPAATADQWQPIETAPKDGSKIDLFVTPPNGAIVGSYDGRVCDCWFSNNKWWLYDDSQYATDADNCRTEVWNVTHWMPRAAPPALTDKRPPMQEDGK